MSRSRKTKKNNPCPSVSSAKWRDELLAQFEMLLINRTKLDHDEAISDISALTSDALTNEEMAYSKQRLLNIYSSSKKQAGRYISHLKNELSFLNEFYGQTSTSRIQHPFRFNEQSIKCGPDIIYSHLTSSYISLWDDLEKMLPQINKKFNLKKLQHNYLALLLTTNDDKFLEEICKGTISCVDELGFIAIQRLRKIAKSGKSSAQRKTANLQLVLSMSSTKDTLLYVDWEALELEIIKLCFFAKTHEKKIAVIGTSRAVDSVNAISDNIMYFNPDVTRHSWQLNKAWLYTAVDLGYEIKLVEQHYPNIERAILSGKLLEYFLELLNEVRPSSSTSQYNGKYEPTATSQEILALLDLGCFGRKNEDGSLSLLPPTATELNEKAVTDASYLKIKRTHSSPQLFKSAPPPPLKSRQDHFKPPQHEGTNAYLHKNNASPKKKTAHHH